MQYFVLDVFAEQPLAGNQLAVFVDADRLSAERMQRLARETNYSETTFVMSRDPGNGGHDVRIFTPKEEVPFAGHPTLGTAFLIRQEILRRPAERVVLNLKIGPVPVDFEYRAGRVDRLWMHQPAPRFGGSASAEACAAMLGLSAGDIDDDFPIQEASTGLPRWRFRWRGPPGSRNSGRTPERGAGSPASAPRG
jgi:trans-2,3-dihydro-3-hydroxyanthranilate isomerase